MATSTSDDLRALTESNLAGLGIKLGADGEILVKGPSLMVGYRGEPEKTAAAIREGGDLLRREGRADRVLQRPWLARPRARA